MLSRRGFLLSSAGIITAVFLKRLHTHIDKFDEPLLLEPSNFTETLYISDDPEWGLIALGSPFITAPNVPRLGPAARAFDLLSRLDLGPDFRNSSKQAGRIEFTEGSQPGDDSIWAAVRDPLSISLLQARLIELKVPLKVEVAQLQ